MRISLEAATAWIDAHVGRLASEQVSLADAAGRILAEDVVAACDVPGCDRAALDGLAVRADATDGASAYNPLRFQPAPADVPLPPYGGMLLCAGDALPPGSDAIVPQVFLEQDGTGGFEIIQGVPPGNGIQPSASHCRKGDVLLPRGRPVSPHDVGLLATAGIARLQVVRQPAVHCILVAHTSARTGVAPRQAEQDANGPLLRALIARDGGRVAAFQPVGRDVPAIRDAVLGQAADLVIIAGGTGPGANDAAATALAAAGEVAIHGIALQPGETAGLGRTAAGVPVCLLPGTPADCLWAYEFLADRVIRRLGGRESALPFRSRRMTTGRKIVSVIGATEVVPVRCVGEDRVEPVTAFAERGLAAVAAADGFVVMAEGSEGVAEDTAIDVRLYDFAAPHADRTTEGTP